MKKLLSLSMAFLMVFTLFSGLESKVFANGDTFSTISAPSNKSFAIKDDGSL